MGAQREQAWPGCRGTHTAPRQRGRWRQEDQPGQDSIRKWRGGVWERMLWWGGCDQLAPAGEGRYAQLGPNLGRGKAKGAGVGRGEVVKSKVGQVSRGQRSYQFRSEMELHLTHILHPSLHHSSTHLLTHDVSSRIQPPIYHQFNPNSSICSSALQVCPLCQVPYHMLGVRTSYLCPSLKELTPRKERVLRTTASSVAGSRCR